MSEGFAYIDILFFAMVAAFIALRLRSVLGRRTGQERRRTGGFPGSARPNGAADGKSASDNVVALPDRSGAAAEADAAIADLAEGKVKTGLTQIRLADPGFDLNQFLTGARAAFEMILRAYAEADVKTLRNMLNDEVYGNFSDVIAERESAGETLDTSLVGITSADIVDARIEGRTAFVTVKFVSEQVNVTRDKSGEAIEGDPNRVTNVTDLWTFARNTKARDPNWTLVETRSPN